MKRMFLFVGGNGSSGANSSTGANGSNGSKGANRSLHTLRQRPLAALASRAVQMVMLTGIVAIGLVSLGLVVAVAVLFGIYALLRQLGGKPTGNFRIQFARGH